MILYAVRWQTVFAVVDVTSDPYACDEADWPYRVDIAWPPQVNVAPANGVEVRELIPDLTDRVRRNSYIRLTPEEFQLLETELQDAWNRLAAIL
jgi:hypothetical protein